MNVFFATLYLLSPMFAQRGVQGRWNLVDEETGRVKNTIEIYMRDGRYFGKVVDVNPRPGGDTDPVCHKCTGARKDLRIVGMDIITGLTFNAHTGELTGGEILDPKSGKVYECKVWLGDDGNLRVRGYKLFFYKTFVLPPAR